MTNSQTEDYRSLAKLFLQRQAITELKSHWPVLLTLITPALSPVTIQRPSGLNLTQFTGST